MADLTPTQKKILAFLNEGRAPVYCIVTRGVYCSDPETDRRATMRHVTVPYHTWERLEIAQITVATEARGGSRHPNLDDPRVAAFIATL